MFKKMMLALLTLTILAVVPAYAASTGCNKIRFFGTYTRPLDNPDVFGDGSNVNHASVVQLTINSDGTVNQFWTGLPDYIINLGTASTSIGSWTCRSDGKLVVSFIFASYFPVPPDGVNLTSQDVASVGHTRATYLYTVDDVNTLTRIQARNRSYAPEADPTDPAGGTLRALNNTPAVYTRLVASDADLLLP